MVITSAGPATSQVSSEATAEVLRVLAVSRSSGALQLRDHPGGTIYLVDGQITYVDVPGAPQLSARLLRSGLVDVTDWANVIAERSSHTAAVEALLTTEVLSEEDLRGLIRTVILDGVTLLLDRSDRQRRRPVFQPGRRHWVGSICPLDAQIVIEEAGRHTSAGSGVGPDHILRLGRPRRRRAVTLTARQWEIAAGICGTATAVDLCWRAGHRLTDMMVDIGSLVDAGLCTAVEPVVPGNPLRDTSEAPDEAIDSVATAADGHQAVPDPVDELPRRPLPETQIPPPPGRPTVISVGSPIDAELGQRLIDGLRRL